MSAEETVALEVTVLAPELSDAEDRCLEHLETALGQCRGVLRAHLRGDVEPPRLCLHYDPNLISLAALERRARQVGMSFSDRYRHPSFAIAGMDAADAATTLESALAGLPGVLHASVNYAAARVFVAYDAEVVDLAQIHQAVEALGYKVVVAAPPAIETEKGDAEHPADSHGSAPSFVPHWLQRRWAMVLLAIAGSCFLIGWLGEAYFGLPPAVALFFFIAAYVAGGYDIATHAIGGLLKGRFDTDVLMLAAAAGAAALGQWSEGAFLLLLFSLGHAGEHFALDRARRAVGALGELMPKTARLKRAGKVEEVDVQRLEIGQVVMVRPGDRIPVDGEVVAGSSAVDQSPITGESAPQVKEVGAEVFAGTINQQAALEVRVTRLARDNTLSRVMQMVAEAQSQQSPTQRFTQRFTARFVPAVLVLVALVALVPPLTGWMPLSESLYRAMLLLVAASPCALALGTPAAVLAGIAQAARNGVLIKGGVHLENLGRVRVMAFDKTGTLTEGRFRVTDLLPMGEADADTLLRVAAAVEQQSNHPLARAVVLAAREAGLELPATGGLENVSGRGVRGEVEGRPVLIGTLDLFRATEGHHVGPEITEAVEGLEGAGKTTMAVSRDGRFVGVIALADDLRPGVEDVLQRLRRLKIERLVMLTGDNREVARQIAARAGIDDVRAELMPADKLRAIEELQRRHGSVAMTGDGVNDAPALALATVGIAMGGAGTAVALETADVALMADDLSRLPFAVGLSRASRRVIQQNLGISLGVIGMLLVSSVAGMVELGWAVVLHEGSSLAVVINALRLLWYPRSGDGPNRGSSSRGSDYEPKS